MPTPTLKVSALHERHAALGAKFAAFGGWDAYGAKSFGYTTYWVNRFGLPTERLGEQADKTSGDITGLLEFVLGDGASKNIEVGDPSEDNQPQAVAPMFTPFHGAFPNLASD